MWNNDIKEKIKKTLSYTAEKRLHNNIDNMYSGKYSYRQHLLIYLGSDEE